MLESALHFLETHRNAFSITLTVLILFVAYKLITRLMRKYLLTKAEKSENVQNFLLLWRYMWMGIGLILILIALSGSFISIGISAAFLGMILGWSLQAPVTGIAAWLMIMLKRPFRLGDRIIISDTIGDVTDINLTHVVLNQVGGTISGEELSGLQVMIPNAILFQQIIYNYTMGTKYILDEVPVAITFQSDLNEAEKMLLDAARTITKNSISPTGKQPFVRNEFTDWGIRMRLRYQTLAMDRQRISSEIVSLIFNAFRQTDKVEFCYPHSEVIYQPKGQIQVSIADKD